jgi:hypothetical protein
VTDELKRMPIAERLAVLVALVKLRETYPFTGMTLVIDELLQDVLRSLSA